jgi:hypothetical protein
VVEGRRNPKLHQHLAREAREGDGDVWPLVMAEYITAVIEQREGAA